MCVSKNCCRPARPSSTFRGVAQLKIWPYTRPVPNQCCGHVTVFSSILLNSYSNSGHLQISCILFYNVSSLKYYFQSMLSLFVCNWFFIGFSSKLFLAIAFVPSAGVTNLVKPCGKRERTYILFIEHDLNISV